MIIFSQKESCTDQNTAKAIVIIPIRDQRPAPAAPQAPKTAAFKPG
ncbi:MAG: hypothetical protein MJK14_03695 [Rivularia sp. ALOHA_DT_140]|nr:hypothetical protein [Rivularia sp. ALOHA_DT_140]